MEHYSQNFKRMYEAVMRCLSLSDLGATGELDKFDMSFEHISTYLSELDLCVGIPHPSVPRVVRFRIFQAFLDMR